MDALSHYVVRCCPECKGQHNGSAAWHAGDCANRNRMFAVEEIEVVPAERLREAVEALQCVVETYDGGTVMRPDFYMAMDEARKIAAGGGQTS